MQATTKDPSDLLWQVAGREGQAQFEGNYSLPAVLNLGGAIGTPGIRPNVGSEQEEAEEELP